MFYIICILGCSPKKDVPIKTNIPVSEQPEKSVEAPTIERKDIAVPSMPQGLPTWDDIEAPDSVYQPVAALALSYDHTKCFKEWFQGDSLPPNIRKYQGRILNSDEPTIGRMIQCPEKRKATLLESLLQNP